MGFIVCRSGYFALPFLVGTVKPPQPKMIGFPLIRPPYTNKGTECYRINFNEIKFHTSSAYSGPIYLVIFNNYTLYKTRSHRAIRIGEVEE